MTAILGERRWLLVLAVASFLAAVGMAEIGNAPTFLLASAACLLGLVYLGRSPRSAHQEFSTGRVKIFLTMMAKTRL